jgi:hypothetical protein
LPTPWIRSGSLLDHQLGWNARASTLDVRAFIVTIEVQDRVQRQDIHAQFGMPSMADARARLKGLVRWDKPYLRVASPCDGTAWACGGTAVFKIADGLAIRLGDLGGANIDATKFIDIYDKLEQQIDGLSHAGSPGFSVILDDGGDKLDVNGEATWDFNQPLWQSNEMRIRMGASTDEQYFAAVADNAALAKYCNRSEQLHDLQRIAEATLMADQYGTLAKALAKVVPLEPSSAWRRPY